MMNLYFTLNKPVRLTWTIDNPPREVGVKGEEIKLSKAEINLLTTNRTGKVEGVCQIDGVIMGRLIREAGGIRRVVSFEIDHFGNKKETVIRGN